MNNIFYFIETISVIILIAYIIYIDSKPTKKKVNNVNTETRNKLSELIRTHQFYPSLLAEIICEYVPKSNIEDIIKQLETLREVMNNDSTT